MKTNNDIKNKIVLADVKNTAKTTDSISWSGDQYSMFTLQIRLHAMSVTIFASNVDTPKSDDWVDMTDFFVGAATITADAILIQSSDVRVKWWKIVWRKTSVTNAIVLDLYRYNKVQSG